MMIRRIVSTSLLAAALASAAATAKHASRPLRCSLDPISSGKSTPPAMVGRFAGVSYT